MSKKLSMQRGSAVTFILTGVVLAVLLVGAVFVVVRHGEQVRKDQAIAEAEKQLADDQGSSESSTPTDDEKVIAGKSESESESSDGISPADLPATGSSLIIGEAISVFVLTTSFVSFLNSRRRLVRYL
ncbi:MAG: hypothetical protein WA087_00030 [Candidatus Saccharimonadales bacterium]